MELFWELWDKFWKDSKGRVVIWQNPNIFLYFWAAFTTLSLFLDRRLADIFGIAGSAVLIIWALLEIFKGVNYFRRLLGLVVLIFAAMSLLKNIQ